MKKHYPRPKKLLLIVLLLILSVGFLGLLTQYFLTKPSLPFNPTIHYAKVNKATIAYYTRGSGEPLILIPGFGMTMQDWDPLLLQQLSKHNTLIIFDYPGVGRSTGNLNDFTETQLAGTVVQLMNDAKIKYANVLGWSLGSFVAQRIAQESPDRIDRLILVSTAFGGHYMIPESPAVDKQMEDRLGGDWQTDYLPLMFPSDKKEAMQAYISRVNEALKNGQAPATPPQTLDARRALEHIFADTEEEETRYKESVNIQSPTLIIMGGKDVLIVPDNAKVVADRIPNAKLKLIPDAGHAVLFQDVDAVSKLITEFLAH